MSTAAIAHIPKARTEAATETRTLAVAAWGTLLVLAVFSAVVTTVGDSAQSLNGDVSSQTWALSGMSLGLAVALLTVERSPTRSAAGGCWCSRARCSRSRARWARSPRA